MKDLSPLVHKTVEFAYRGARLTFDLSHALFSSYDIDSGTKLFLKEIAHDEVICTAGSILDSGCGVGVIGLSMAASCPGTRLVLKDRDLLACAISERNAWRNGLPVLRLELDGSPAASIEKKPPKHKKLQERTAELIIAPGLLAETDPLGPYDAILSNLPAKAGGPVLSSFLSRKAPALLNPGGRLAFVIVAPLAEAAAEYCAEAGLTLVKRVSTKNHSVCIYEKPAQSLSQADLAERPVPGLGEAGLAGSYLRSKGQRKLGSYRLPCYGIWGLPEFDTTSYATDLGIEALAKACAGSLIREFCVINPGIGLSSLWARSALGCDRIQLVSRDSLSLRAATANLAVNFKAAMTSRCNSAFDTERIEDASLDALLCVPDEIPGYDYVQKDWEFIARALKMSASAVIVASPTVIARYEKARPAGIWKLGEMKKKGFAALLVRRMA
ncbi:MAG: methyltransferase [Spirochaetia bacterium]|jgi:16S rRNA G1207 methylase RsmC|nr:methyltransferase [Spirochaetia bacterium]